MFKFLIVMFFFFLLLVFLLGFSIIRSFKNALFGGGNRTRKEEGRERTMNTGRDRSPRREERGHGYTRRKKIFDKSDGEYVDYEEVK